MLTGVMTVAIGLSMTLVASSRPPSPVSSSTTSASCSANRQNAAAVSISKIVIGSPCVDLFAVLQHPAQLGIAYQPAAAALADAKHSLIRTR